MIFMNSMSITVAKKVARYFKVGVNGSYMKRSHARTLQLSSKQSGYVLYTVLGIGF